MPSPKNPGHQAARFGRHRPDDGAPWRSCGKLFQAPKSTLWSSSLGHRFSKTSRRSITFGPTSAIVSPPPGLRPCARIAFKLRKEHFDCVVNFHASPSSSMLSFATGARRAIHPLSRPQGQEPLLDGQRSRAKEPSSPSSSATWTRCARSASTCPAGRLPRIALQPAELADARARLAKLGFVGPVLGLGLGRAALPRAGRRAFRRARRRLVPRQARRLRAGRRRPATKKPKCTQFLASDRRSVVRDSA